MSLMNAYKTKQYFACDMNAWTIKDDEIELTTSKPQLDRSKRKSLTPGEFKRCLNGDRKKKKMRILREKMEESREKEEKMKISSLEKKGACKNGSLSPISPAQAKPNQNPGVPRSEESYQRRPPRLHGSPHQHFHWRHSSYPKTRNQNQAQFENFTISTRKNKTIKTTIPINENPITPEIPNFPISTNLNPQNRRTTGTLNPKLNVAAAFANHGVAALAIFMHSKLRALHTGIETPKIRIENENRKTPKSPTKLYMQPQIENPKLARGPRDSLDPPGSPLRFALKEPASTIPMLSRSHLPPRRDAAVSHHRHRLDNPTVINKI
ncbi:hypothetical protein LR48_Vigan08g173300 [Vigna angularis]|uniref:Uncharacterized protein n=1 Tax=Phaseolus angularis TaxID=3914 RepID=A0A0L9V769_PHAAN|nr:hypothetical protein LR48_Vigan08g173300 [Vigna angularis]